MPVSVSASSEGRRVWLRPARRASIALSRPLNRRRRGLLSVVVLAVVMTASGAAQQRPDPQTAVNDAFNQFRTLKEGKNADYIPALAKVDPNLFGIALVTVDGKVFTAGDVKTEVSIQSISKVFTMAQVIEEQGLESIEKRIGVDATGARFNSIIAVEGVAHRRRRRRAGDEPAGEPGRDLGDEHGDRRATPTRYGRRSSAFHNDCGRPHA